MIDELAEKAWALRRIQEVKDEAALSEADIVIGVKTWSDNGGDVDKIAAFLKIDPYLLNRKRPESAEEFSKRLLIGGYTGESKLRSRRSTLRRTETKSAAGLSEIGQAFAAKIYTENGGDVDKIATFRKIDPPRARRSSPSAYS